ncbi:hypothetical protein ACH5RR_018170 [Cinchona calisaya]|uniref:Uncharacterized protein n=1 Tax=Cinchona calisaya TaxID=153742 RepID=A0ABD2ZKT9_9GENT
MLMKMGFPGVNMFAQKSSWISENYWERDCSVRISNSTQVYGSLQYGAWLRLERALGSPNSWLRPIANNGVSNGVQKDEDKLLNWQDMRTDPISLTVNEGKIGKDQKIILEKGWRLVEIRKFKILWRREVRTLK